MLQWKEEKGGERKRGLHYCETHSEYEVKICTEARPAAAATASEGEKFNMQHISPETGTDFETCGRQGIAFSPS